MNVLMRSGHVTEWKPASRRVRTAARALGIAVLLGGLPWVAVAQTAGSTSGSSSGSTAGSTRAAMTPADSDSQYQRDRAACDDGRSYEDKATCLREAGAAREARAKGQLSDDASAFAANRAARCEPLSGDQRRDCLDRAAGGGSSEGSVGAGGIFRESITRDIAPQAPVVPVTVPQPESPDVPRR